MRKWLKRFLEPKWVAYYYSGDKEIVVAIRRTRRQAEEAAMTQSFQDWLHDERNTRDYKVKKIVKD